MGLRNRTRRRAGLIGRNSPSRQTVSRRVVADSFQLRFLQPGGQLSYYVLHHLLRAVHALLTRSRSAQSASLAVFSSPSSCFPCFALRGVCVCDQVIELLLPALADVPLKRGVRGITRSQNYPQYAPKHQLRPPFRSDMSVEGDVFISTFISARRR